MMRYCAPFATKNVKAMRSSFARYFWQDDMPGVSGAVQLSDAKSARALGTEITQAGIALYDLLQQEPALRGARNRYSSDSAHNSL